MESKYEKDFYAWCEEQAEYIMGRRFNDIDVVNLYDEIRSLWKREEQNLSDLMAILFTHLLLWKFMKPTFIFPYRCESWQRTIQVHREKIKERLEDNPSLNKVLPKLIEEAYRQSRYSAYQRTTCPQEAFPEVMPFSFENAMQTDWLPE